MQAHILFDVTAYELHGEDDDEEEAVEDRGRRINFLNGLIKFYCLAHCLNRSRIRRRGGGRKQ